MKPGDLAVNRKAAIARCAASFVVGAVITSLLLLEPDPATSTHHSGAGVFFSIFLSGLNAGLAGIGAALTIAKASRGMGQLMR